MSFPSLPEKHQSEPILRAETLLEMRQRSGKFPKDKPPNGVVFCMRADIPRRMGWRIPLRKVGRSLGDIHFVRSSNGRVGVLSNFGIGAPALTAFAEEMIAWGVKRFVIVSWGGILQPDLQSGDIVVVDKAIRDEGTSHHYLPYEKFAHADVPLMTSLTMQLSAQTLSIKTGAAWTMDAPYRETKAEVEQYRSEGIQVVEMETAALFALAQVKNVAAASLVVAADDLSDLTWRAPENMKAVDRSFQACYSAAIQTLSGDA